MGPDRDRPKLKGLWVDRRQIELTGDHHLANWKTRCREILEVDSIVERSPPRKILTGTNSDGSAKIVLVEGPHGRQETKDGRDLPFEADAHLVSCTEDTAHGITDLRQGRNRPHATHGRHGHCLRDLRERKDLSRSVGGSMGLPDCGGKEGTPDLPRSAVAPLVGRGAGLLCRQFCHRQVTVDNGSGRVLRGCQGSNRRRIGPSLQRQDRTCLLGTGHFNRDVASPFGRNDGGKKRGGRSAVKCTHRGNDFWPVEGWFSRNIPWQRECRHHPQSGSSPDLDPNRDPIEVIVARVAVADGVELALPGADRVRSPGLIDKNGRFLGRFDTEAVTEQRGRPIRIDNRDTPSPPRSTPEVKDRAEGSAIRSSIDVARDQRSLPLPGQPH